MRQKSMMRQAFSRIYMFKKSAIWVAVFSGILRAVTPYLYIFATAAVVKLLTEGANWKKIAMTAGSAVALRMLLSVTGYWISNLHMENLDGSNMQEKNQITKSLFNVDYDKLEGTDLERMVLRHRDELLREGGILNKYLSMLESFTGSVFGLAAAAVSLLPFVRSLFINGDSSFTESPWFGVAVLTAAALAIWFLFVVKGKAAKENVALRDEYAKHNFIFAYYRNLISNYKTGKEIRVFHQAPFVMEQVNRELIEEGIPLQREIAARSGYATGFGDWIFAIMTFGFYLLVGVRAAAGFYALGDAVAYVGCFTQITGGFGSLSGIFAGWKTLTPRAERYENILRMAEETSEPAGVCPKVVEAIQFDDVTFRYQHCQTDTAPALQNLNLTLYRGEKLAIVGENGSGKTTFVKLLCGLYQPEHGRIMLNGTDIKTYDRKEYQYLFSVVFQDSQLFALPLGENLAADEKVDEQRAKRCLEQAGLTKYGLDTMLYQDCDPNGVNISGGEAQKLTLARALYRDKSVLVLDEPTAALDPYAEYRLYEQFNRLTEGKTAIYISHRLSSCRFCDRIAVFDHGKLIQCGTHDELVRDTEGKYYALWSAQAKYYTK